MNTKERCELSVISVHQSYEWFSIVKNGIFLEITKEEIYMVEIILYMTIYLLFSLYACTFYKHFCFIRDNVDAIFIA